MMPDRAVHGREPEPTEELLDCLAYVEAVHDGQDDAALIAYDVLRMRLSHRADAMNAPLRLATLLLAAAGQQGCDARAMLATVRSEALAKP